MLAACELGRNTLLPPKLLPGELRSKKYVVRSRLSRPEKCLHNTWKAVYWKQKLYNTEIQIFTNPEKLSTENRKCVIRAPDIIFIKNSSIKWDLFLLGYMSVIW
jgi:hypothetical protein